MNKNSLKYKMILIFGSLALVLVLSCSFVLYYQSRGILNSTIEKQALNDAIHNAENLSTWLEEKELLIRVLAETDSMESMDWSSQLPILQSVAEHEKNMSIYVSDLRGNFKADLEGELIEGNISDREYFKEVLETKQSVFSEPIMNKGTNVYSVAVASPIFDNNKIVGVLGAIIDLSYLQDVVKEMKITGHGNGWIIDKNKTTIAHPEEEYLGNKKIFEGNQELEKIATDMVNANQDYVDYKLNDKEKILAYAPIKSTGWSVAVAANKNNVLAPLDIIKIVAVWVAVIGMLVAVVVTFFLAGNITNPIKSVTEFAGIVADGDISNDVPNEFLARNDEIGQLAEAFQLMTDNLRNMISNVAEIAESLSASSEELSATSEEISASAEQVGTAIQEVASGAEEQSAQVDETGDRVENLSNKIDNVKNISLEMDKQAETVMDNMEEGNDLINTSISRVKEVKYQSNAVSNKIDNLGKLSEEISDIIELISGISEQTNLLALNAAIEAARAGESGRGFSVVADEIRELAEESSEATEQIADLISDIQTGVEETINQMGEAENAVETSVEVIQTTEDSFAEIKEAANNLSRQIEVVSTRANEMADNSNQVERAIEEIATVSEEASSNAEEVAASSEEQVSSTQEIVSSSERLAEMAEKLSKTVDQFKL